MADGKKQRPPDEPNNKGLLLVDFHLANSFTDVIAQH